MSTLHLRALAAPLLVLALGLAACRDGSAPTSDFRNPSRIAFEMRRDGTWDIYSVRADGSGLVNLTRLGAEDYHPAWTVDHSRIAWYSVANSSGVWIMNADGSGRRQILGGYEVDRFAWSPDGNRIAFVGFNSLGSDSLYVVNADGTGLHIVPTPAPSPRAADWSPDGTRIAIAAGPAGNSDIWLIDPDGSRPVNLTAGATASDEADPAWSRDGARIAFASDVRGAGMVELHTIPAAGGQWQRVTDEPGGFYADRRPRWSHDGTQLVYERVHWPAVYLLTVPATGGASRALTDTLNATVSGSPSW